MGCYKSKMQHAGTGRQNARCASPQEVDQEVGMINNGNFQLGECRLSNSGCASDGILYYNDFQGNQTVGNIGQQTGHSYNSVNTTGSFGETSPSINSNRPRQYYQSRYMTNYNRNLINVSVDRITEVNDLTYNYFSPNQIQQLFDMNPYHSQGRTNNSFNQAVMGPPTRRASRTNSSLVYHRSFNDDFRRAYQNNQSNSVVRHGSLENLSGFRGRLYRNKFSSDNNLHKDRSSFIEQFPSHLNPSWESSINHGQKRGVKRNLRDDDSESIFIDNSGTEAQIQDANEVAPRVKRRASDTADSPRNTQSVKSNNNENDVIGDVNGNVGANTIMNNDTEMLSCYEEPFDVIDILVFPDDWSSQALAKTRLVEIPLSSSEGISVQSYFGRSSQSKDFRLCIKEISRIENPFMHTCYMMKKQEMKSRNQRVDELYLFHGTKKDHLAGIFEGNLDWRLHSENHRFGQGVSFSPLATYSSHYSDKSPEKVMLLFKVLTSNSICGHPELEVPPITTSVTYDTSIKDDATVIVKYSDNEFYPLYKITYSKVSRN